MRKPPFATSGSPLRRASPAGIGALGTVLAFMLLATPVPAQEEMPEGAQLAVVGFESIDEDGSGTASLSELLAFGDLVFVSMDTDESGGVDPAEFESWGWGFENLAVENDRAQAFAASQRIMADLLDRNNDGAFSPEELQESLASSFAYADLDGDSALTQDEYLQGLIFNIALRNSVAPDAP